MEAPGDFAQVVEHVGELVGDLADPSCAWPLCRVVGATSARSEKSGRRSRRSGRRRMPRAAQGVTRQCGHETAPRDVRSWETPLSRQDHC